MNGKLAVLFLVMASTVLATCQPDTNQVRPDESKSADAVDEAAKGNPNYRTWAVERTGESNDPHMRTGDAFRLMKTGNSFSLEPLARLKGRWGYDASDDYAVDLEKINAELLCGEVQFVGHSPETHKITVEVRRDDLLFVEFLLPEKSCTSQDTHGGTAHAQN